MKAINLEQRHGLLKLIYLITVSLPFIRSSTKNNRWAYGILSISSASVMPYIPALHLLSFYSQTWSSPPNHSHYTLCSLLVSCISSSTAGGLPFDLIPHDSPLSPFYNPSNTHFSRFYDAFCRSLKHANHLKTTLESTNRIQTTLVPGRGEYLMKISFRTPIC